MLWAGQFGIAGGEALEETPWVGAFPDPRPSSEEPSDLYLIVEPALPGSAEFCGELKEAVGRVFHREKVSLTGGLLKALRAAHEHLRDWNERSLKEHRVAAGLSCLAVQDSRGYLAQVGPARAAVYRRGSLTTFRPELPDALEPLGLQAEFWPDFQRVELDAGARLLLLSPALFDAVSAQELAADLALPEEDVLPALYRRARDLPDCGALLLAAIEDGRLAVPA